MLPSSATGCALRGPSRASDGIDGRIIGAVAAGDLHQTMPMGIEHHGMVVEYAESGNAVLETVNQSEFDVVLMDKAMRADRDKC